MAVPGARALFASLPEHRRAVVTSGTPPIATARLRAAGFPLPRTLVTADDVTRGKPDPQPYLLAAQRLGVPPDRCLAVEDAPAGIASARAAGCQVLAVTGTAPAEELADAALTVDGLDRVAVHVDDEALRLKLAYTGRRRSAVVVSGGGPVEVAGERIERAVPVAGERGQELLRHLHRRGAQPDSAPGAAPPARPSPGRRRPAAPGAWRSPAA